MGLNTHKVTLQHLPVTPGLQVHILHNSPHFTEDRGNEAPPPQDFGLAFRHHGWKESNYTAAPKPTVRDSVGFIPDILADPLTYVPPAGLAPERLLSGIEALLSGSGGCAGG